MQCVMLFRSVTFWGLINIPVYIKSVPLFEFIIVLFMLSFNNILT